MSHQYKTDDVIQLQVLCLLQKLLYLLPGKWHDDFKLDSRCWWRLGPDSLTTPSLSIYYLSVGGEGGRKAKGRRKPISCIFPTFFLTLLFLNVSLLVKQTPDFSLRCTMEQQLHPSPKAAPYRDPCFCDSVVSQVNSTVSGHLLNHTDRASQNPSVCFTDSGLERWEEKFSSSE